MDINRQFSVFFSGYRPEKISFDINNKILLNKLHVDLERAIIKALGLGYRFFYCGMAKGFDLIAGETLLFIREQYPQYKCIRLIAGLPYTEHGYNGRWEGIHENIKRCADQIVIISPEYRANCYSIRNQYMIDNSNYLICYHDGQEGGTAQTIRMAKRAGLFISNIFNNGI